LSSVLSAIIEFPTSITEGSNLFDELSVLKNKLPRELFDGEGGLRLDDPAVVENMVKNAKEHLLARLLSEGGDQGRSSS